MRRAARTAVLLAMIPMLAACPYKSAIWLEPGSTAQHLVLGFGESKGGPPAPHLYALAVVRCGADETPANALWAIARDSEVAVPRTIVYGEVPTGYREIKPARVLEPGCYRIADTGSGRLNIRVTSDGSVREDNAVP